MIRKAEVSDVKELCELENLIFSKSDFALSLGSFYYHIKNSHLYVYESNTKIVAYILWLQRKEYYRLYSICVDENHQGVGIGKKLLDFSFKTLNSKKYILEVKISNTEAIFLYEKYGFKIKKILKGFYADNIDGYMMEREYVK